MNENERTNEWINELELVNHITQIASGEFLSKFIVFSSIFIFGRYYILHIHQPQSLYSSLLLCINEWNNEWMNEWWTNKWMNINQSLKLTNHYFASSNHHSSLSSYFSACALDKFYASQRSTWYHSTSHFSSWKPSSIDISKTIYILHIHRTPRGTKVKRFVPKLVCHYIYNIVESAVAHSIDANAFNSFNVYKMTQPISQLKSRANFFIPQFA